MVFFTLTSTGEYMFGQDCPSSVRTEINLFLLASWPETAVPILVVFCAFWILKMEVKFATVHQRRPIWNTVRQQNRKAIEINKEALGRDSNLLGIILNINTQRTASLGHKNLNILSLSSTQSAYYSFTQPSLNIFTSNNKN